MPEKYCNHFSDMARIKEDLISLFCHTEDLTRLAAHCFNTPYIEGIMAGHASAIFIETYLTKKTSQRIKEVGIDIYILCHKDSIELPEADKAYYQSKGIYGNRIDSAIQIIHASLSAPQTANNIKENYSLGGLSLSSEKDPLTPYSPGAGFYGKCLSYIYQSFHQRK